MKQISKFIFLFSITIMFFSCARQNHPELVGHYKPKTNVKKTQLATSYKTESEIAKLYSVDKQSISASTDIAAPELNLMFEPEMIIEKYSTENTINDEKAGRLEKKLNRLVEKRILIKHEAQLSSKSENEVKKNSNGAVSKVLLIILCFLLPPLAVGLAKGIGWPFWLSVILTLCFWVPGIIYALIVILGD